METKMTSVAKQHEYPRHEYSAIARYSLSDFTPSGQSSFDRESDSPYARFSVWVSKQDMDLCLSNVMITREDAGVLSSMNMDWLSLGAGEEMTEYQVKSYNVWSLVLGPDFFYPDTPDWASSGVLYRKVSR